MSEEKGLSDRERQILRLVATGASNKEIARQLVISTNTVKVHLRNIFAKIGVMSRTEATLYAIREGLAQVGEARPADAPASDEPAETAAESEPGPVSKGAHDTKRRRLVAAVTLAAIALLLVMTGVWAGASLGPQATATPTVEVTTSTPAPVAAPSRWRLRASMPTARAGLGVAVYDGRIYAIAGDAAGGPTGANERYDPNADAWEIVGSKPVPVADVSAAVVGGRVYVPGGRLASGAVTSTVEVYDPVRNAWAHSAPLPVALSAYAMVAFEGRLYVFGGWDGAAYQADTYEYDPGRDVWTVRPPMPTARGFAGAAVAGGRIYVVGGKGEGGAGLAVNEVFSPNKEGTLAWTVGVPLPDGRMSPGVIAVADVVYVIAGATAAAIPAEPLRYAPLTQTWQAFESASAISWSEPGLAALEDLVYTAGGRIDGSVSAEVRSYQAIYTVLIPSMR